MSGIEWFGMIVLALLGSIAFDQHRAKIQRSVMCDYLQEIRNEVCKRHRPNQSRSEVEEFYDNLDEWERMKNER
jgi:hypothetical protein